MKNPSIKSLALTLLLLGGISFLPSCSTKDNQIGGRYENADVAKMAPEPISTEEAGEDPEIPIEHNTEEYDLIRENEFMAVVDNPLSTFSIDVDNAAYSNIRRFIESNSLPPKDAVRIEEMINYFTYEYPQPQGAHPFEFVTEFGECPWNKDNLLLHIGIQGKSLNYDELKACNLVFLVDASGSMESANKLPLLKKSLGILLDELDDKDRVAIVAYAGAAGLVCPSTPASEKDKILKALNKLNAGGSTAGGEGIELAYQTALENLIEDGNNRVILCTDGDFNVGVSSTGDLVRMIEEKRKQDIYLTICGFGMGNYKDGRMEQISNAGNGNFFYIDNMREAEKVFKKEMRANLFTIAKDVKIQIEFNPEEVESYRLIGYENRVMAKEDFNDDTKDAGELGAGHTVTVLYEIVRPGSGQTNRKVDALKYQASQKTADAASGEWATIKFRYKKPSEDTSNLIEHAVSGGNESFGQTSENFRFSASVAGFGLLLRESKYKGDLEYADVLDWAKGARSYDPEDYRSEFVTLVKEASLLAPKEN